MERGAIRCDAVWTSLSFATLLRPLYDGTMKLLWWGDKIEYKLSSTIDVEQVDWPEVDLKMRKVVVLLQSKSDEH